MPLRDEFDAIADSMRNGQRTQAVRQMQDLGLHEVPELLEYFAEDLRDIGLALDTAKSYFRIISR